MPRPPFGPVLAAALLGAGPCLADPPPAPPSTPLAPTPAAPPLDLPARPPVCVPLPPLTA